jgi:CRP-like cAMP-binding protein
VDAVSLLRDIPMLDVFSETEIAMLAKCLSPKVLVFETDETVFDMGETRRLAGTVRSGCVKVEYCDVHGNRNIIAVLGRGDAAVSHLLSQGRLLFRYAATERSQVLIINCDKLFKCAREDCGVRVKMLELLLQLSAETSQLFARKMRFITQRTTREKLCSFFDERIRETGGRSFRIGLTRQELADYLSVNRSALSRELSKMQDEGLLRFHHDSFEILTAPLPFAPREGISVGMKTP